MTTTRSLLLVAVLAAAGLVLGACGDDGEPASPARTPVVIDSDGAFDDHKAIAYLLAQPDLEVLALPMSGTGIARCPAAAENMAAILELLEAPEIPVACGRSAPLEGFNTAPTAWRDGADTLGGLPLPEPRELDDRTAPELLADAVSSADGQVTLVALGPLTNVAEAIEADPAIVDRISMVYLMGGAVDVGGNVAYAGNDTAEFNIWADPRAAAIVFATEVPITLVPLDATNDAPVTPEFYEAIAAHREVSPTSAFLADYLDRNPLVGGIYHWDELAAVVVTDESVATFDDRMLAIVEEGGIEAGATVEATDGRPVRVAVTADPAAFAQRFYDATIGTPDPGVTPWVPDATVAFDGTTCAYDGPDPLPDEMAIRIDNRGDETIAVIFGAYDPGTTAADLDAWLDDPSGGEPSWWTSRIQMFVPDGAHDVWIVEGDPDTTAICFAELPRMWELAGPRLAEG